MSTWVHTTTERTRRGKDRSSTFKLSQYRELRKSGRSIAELDDVGFNKTKFRRSIEWYYDKPVEFVENVIGAHVDPWQKDFLIAVRDKRKIACATSTGVGKSAAAAWAIIWYLVCRGKSVVVCTAPNARLLNKVLWKELNKWIEKSEFLKKTLIWTETTVKHRKAPAQWHALAKTTGARYSEHGNEVFAEGIQGEHADHMLIVIDEASGVDTASFESLEGTMTGFENKMIVLGNPLRTEGRFFEIFNKGKFARYWTRFRVSSLPHPKATYVSARGNQGGHAQELVDVYGEKSAYIQARVYGQFPTNVAIDTGFTVDEVTSAQNREFIVTGDCDCQIGMDCARYGNDETVVMVRRGWKITRTVVKQKLGHPDKMALIKQIMIEEAVITCQLKGIEPTPEALMKHMPIVNIDEGEGGGGAAILDDLWGEGFTNVNGVMNNEAPVDEILYANLASEMWLGELHAVIDRLDLSESYGVTRQWVEGGILKTEGGEPDEELERQLVTRRYEFTKNGPQRRVESKDKMKQRGLSSPDRADALCLAIHAVLAPGVL